MKRCKAKGCTTRFDNPQPFVCWCSAACGAEIAKERLAKAKTKKAKEERKADKAKRDRLKTRSDYMKDAQREFNKYIRLRDAARPCVSCGRFHEGQYHAGHYLSTGARPELRFDERNVHKQCSACNTHLHGNLVLYRGELIRRIGLPAVVLLEGPHAPAKHTIGDLIELIATYKAKAKELEKA